MQIVLNIREKHKAYVRKKNTRKEKGKFKFI